MTQHINEGLRCKKLTSFNYLYQTCSPSLVGPGSTVGSVSSLAILSSKVRFRGPAHSFTNCQLLSTG